MFGIKNWRYQPTAHRRDLRLDLLRGYLIFVMTVNHLLMAPSWAFRLTGLNAMWVTAAEGFVLVSGIVFGMLYRQRSQDKGWEWTWQKVGKRALQLYLVTVVWQLFFGTLDFIQRDLWGRESSLPESYLDFVQNAIFQVRSLLLGVDLLPMYVVLLPWGALVIYLLSKGKWPWVLAASVLFWHLRRLDPEAFTFFHVYFNPALWQILFTVGILAGYYRNELHAARARLVNKHPVLESGFSWLLALSALAILLVGYQVAFRGLWADIWWLDPRGDFFSKNTLAPGRVVASIWVVAGLYELVSIFWKPLHRLVGWALLPAGQNSLTAYVVQASLVYLVASLPGYPFPGHGRPGLMTMIHFGCFLFVVLLTKIIAAWNVRKHARLRPVAGDHNRRF